MFRPLVRLALAFTCALGLQAQPPARQIRIAAASDLKWALEEAKAAFERDTPGITCALTFGASGAFHAQLSQHAPFDLFLSADTGYPERLVADGLGRKEDLFPYAVGHLVLWVPKASPIPLEQLGLQGLLHPAARRIAMANPRHAPYGRAAEATLKAAGLQAQVADRLVLGENIAQTAQFVQTGNADLGFLSRSLATSAAMRDQGRLWPVPDDLHPPLLQAGLILPWAQDAEAARAFRAWLTGPKGAALLQRHGFSLPERK